MVAQRVLTWVEPEIAFVALFAREARSVWLDSGDTNTGMSLMAAPTIVIRRDEPAGALELLDEVIASTKSAAGVPAPLGWVGWVGFEAGAAAAGAPVHSTESPALLLARVDRVVVFDHAERVVRLLAETSDDGRICAEEWVSATSAALAQAADSPHLPAPREPMPTVARWRHDRDAYLARIRECQRRIAEGDVYQVCLCNACSVSGAFDALEVYRRVRRSNPTHHGALLRFDDLALVCGSPEQFLSVDGDRRATTRPIKGTRPRAADARMDAAGADELRSSEKERAENLMIVDLMRNDLGRVAEIGSVAVTELFGVEHYSTVHQLVSTIEARLDPATSVGELLRSCLPPGSMTGAPKLSAMRIIHELEAGPRGVFSGVVGRVSCDGTLDLAVVIRSILVTPTRASFGAGGGITALSNAEEEYAEVQLKARTMLAALGASVD